MFCFFISFLLLMLQVSFEEDKIIQTRIVLASGRYSLPIIKEKDNDISYIKTIDPSSQYLVSTSYEPPSNKIEDTTITSRNGSVIPVSLISEEIHFQNFSTRIKHYTITNDKYFGFVDESLPFAHTFPDPSFSVVHQLYNEGKISHLSYGLGQYADYKGYLYLGGIPKEETSSLYHSKCDVNSDDVNWSCKLEYVYFGNDKSNSKIYINQKYSKFSSSEWNILVPTNFIYYMKETVFKEMIEQHRCTFIKSSLYHFFHCDCNLIDKFPDINFVFDGRVYSLKMVDLFRVYDPSEMGVEYCEFLVSKNNEDEEAWSFGISFLEHFKTLFDYENNKISFYSTKPIEHFESSNGKTLKTIFDVIIVVLMLAVISELFIGYKGKKI